MIGVIAVKGGSSVLFCERGEMVHVTALHIDDCVVLDARKSGDACATLTLAAGVSKRGVAKPQRGIFEKKGIDPRAHVRQFEFRGDTIPDIGDTMLPSMFNACKSVNVIGTSKGKGFAGVMKRHGFGGLFASHGVSVSHRSHGSTGQRTYPSKVFKGKKMAGRMGGSRVTVKNLKVMSADDDGRVLFVKGAVPGHVGSYVMVVGSKICKS